MELRQKAYSIIHRLRDCGYKSYLCGGCVRDLLLGREPKDYDIVTDADPRTICKIFKRTIGVGAKFGIIQVLLDADTFEVATFRKDGGYSDGRRPDSIDLCDEREDALRRDFTINGMFYEVETNHIIDYVGGQKDLQNKIIRTIGSSQQRFSEDYLRLLRAIRFACQLGFTIEDATWSYIVKMAPLIQKISKERIRDELCKMLMSTNPHSAISMMAQSALLPEILPEINGLTPAASQDITAHLMSFLEKGRPFNSPQLPMAILLRTIENFSSSPPSHWVYELGTRLRFPRKTIEKLSDVLKYYKKWEQVSQMNTAELKRFLRLSIFSELFELYRLECIVENRPLTLYEYCQKKISEFENSMKPTSLITGEDLIHLGFRPGPLFKKILNFIEEQQLEGKVTNSQEALSLIRKEFGQSYSMERNEL